MNLLHPIDHGTKAGKTISCPAGDYKSGTLPKEVEDHFIDLGYFELSKVKKEKTKKETEKTKDLTVAAISKLSVPKLEKQLPDLNEEDLNELYKLELERDPNPREKAVSSITMALNAFDDSEDGE